MSFGAIIDTILLKPLQLLFEIIYMTANDFLWNPGLSIIVLSLVMNFLLLPLYKRADAIQDEERDMETRLHDGVEHIRKTFHGDERTMILQTYYRQNHYKPTYVLRGALSLFLEIPFFMAAYRFLSELQLLQGVSFGPIADLGRADGMLVVAGTAINVLPVVMTVVNLISCSLYTKGSPLKSKIQLYAMAGFFLVFLYDSPAGLVLYWTLNNVFSLVKTIFYKLKNPGKVLIALASAAGLAILACSGFCRYPKEIASFLILGLVMQIPLVCAVLKRRGKIGAKASEGTPNKNLFFAGCIFLALLTGALIPSAVLSASPQEFVEQAHFYHPLWFVVSASCLAFGAFVVWAGVFYWLSKSAGKLLFEKAVWLLCGLAIVNYMFFGKDLGLLSSTLKFQNGLDFTWKEQLSNLVILTLVGAVLYGIFKIWSGKLVPILVAGCLTVGCMSGLNIAGINRSVDEIKGQVLSTQDEKASLPLSQSGENVIVLMLDMAMGEYIPYIFQEKPELVEQFDGFTYYSNVISFGGHTVYGTPALFGGYEYTPYEMNKRSDETLVDKHNEALRVMPLLFSQNGFRVTVTDPPLANYSQGRDISIYEESPELNAYVTIGRFSDDSLRGQTIPYNERNFFCYSLVKSLPLCLQEGMYDQGRYRQGNPPQLDVSEDGLTTQFLKSYNVLDALPGITHISDSAQNNFILMANETPHEGVILQKPDYVPSLHVDNTEFEGRHEYIVDGRKLDFGNGYSQEKFYHANMATMLRLGEWFDYLRENNVYDNTRIILVSDHAAMYGNFEELLLEDGTDATIFYPLLMVKDFGSTGFTTSDKFMTNGDVPTLAADGLIRDPVNPFTGKIVNSDEKAAHVQYVYGGHKLDPLKNGETAFLPAVWYTIHDNIWEKDNWGIVAGENVLPTEG